MGKQGIFENIPFREYLTGEGWSDCESHTSLKSLKEGPNYYKALKDKSDLADEGSLSKSVGDATDCMVLEPLRFQSDYVVYEGIRRGAQYDKFCEENQGRTILSESEYDTAKSVASCVRSHSLASKLIESTDHQLSLRWQDPETGIWCKGRVDGYDQSTGLLLDLKTTKNPRPEEFAKSIFVYHYYTQLAFYAKGLRVLGKEVNNSVIVAVSNHFPFLDCRVYEVVPGALVLGEQEINALLALLAKCRAKNEWPGREESVELIGIPEWGESIIQQRMEQYGKYIRH